MYGLNTIPDIPSASELQYGAGWGRGTDSRIAHLTTGEHVVPIEVLQSNPKLAKDIAKAIKDMGGDPRQYIVGSDYQSINPETGNPEFGWFSNPFKKIKKLVKKIAGSTIGKIALTAVAAAYGGPAAAAAVSGATTKLSGGSWGQALGSAAGTYLGSSIGSSMFGSPASSSVVPTSGMGPIAPTAATSGFFGSGGNVAGYSTVGNLLGSTASSALPASVTNASLASIIGTAVGDSYGTAIGGALLGAPTPKQDGGSWGSFNDSYGFSSGSDVATPTTADNSGDSGGTYGTGGAGIAQDPGGVTYLSSIKNRDTGTSQYRPELSFSSSMAGRRAGWGGTFASY